MKKYLIGFAILALWLSALGYSLHSKMAGWLNQVQFAMIAIYVVGGSILTILSSKRRRIGGQLGMFPPSWHHWILGESDKPPKEKP